MENQSDIFDQRFEEGSKRICRSSTNAQIDIASCKHLIILVSFRKIAKAYE